MKKDEKLKLRLMNWGTEKLADALILAWKEKEFLETLIKAAQTNDQSNP